MQNNDPGSREMLKNMKILYVEDDPQAREELLEVLKRRVGKVFSGENGKQGLELYLDHEPDIVIADLYMPEMDGLEMIRQIRAAGHAPEVIVTSAVEDANTIIGAIDAGVAKYILKPVDLSELLEVLRQQASAIYERRNKQAAALPENRKKVEDEMKKEFSAFLKSTTGKGPREVSVFMNDERIELVASEILTIFEKNLLDNYQNIAIICHIREMFFSVKGDEICQLLTRISGRRVMLKEVVINIEKDKNKLIFTIEHDG